MSTELIKRGAFTLGALLIYWFGLRVPLPGVDAAAWMQIFAVQSGGMLGEANALSGGGLRSLSVLSLSITPYVTSALIVQLLAMVSRRIGGLRNAGERGRRTIASCALYGAVVLSALQAYGIAIALEGVGPVVPEPGLLFRLMTVLTLTAGTLFVIWLAGQITARGLGNGIALIIAAGIVNVLPGEITGLIELARQGAIAPGAPTLVAAGTAVVTAIVVVFERSRRRLPVEFAERRGGISRQTVTLELKLNPAGLVPSYLASLALTLVVVAAMIVALYGESGWAETLRVALGHGTLLHLVVTAALIAFLTFLYTAFVCDPEQMAARLAACGGTLPGVPPGEATAAHLDRAISRTAVFGAVYLVFVMLLPEIITAWVGLPFRLGGVSILVLVCVLLDLTAEARACLAIER